MNIVIPPLLINLWTMIKMASPILIGGSIILGWIAALTFSSDKERAEELSSNK